MHNLNWCFSYITGSRLSNVTELFTTSSQMTTLAHATNTCYYIYIGLSLCTLPKWSTSHLYLLYHDRCMIQYSSGQNGRYLARGLFGSAVPRRHSRCDVSCLWTGSRGRSEYRLTAVVTRRWRQPLDATAPSNSHWYWLHRRRHVSAARRRISLGRVLGSTNSSCGIWHIR